MTGRNRLAILVCALASMIAAASCGAAAGDALDTSKLPRISGGTEVFSSPLTTIYTSPQDVASAATGLAQVFAGDGWQKYVPPFTEMSKVPNSEFLSFKKGPQAVKVSITLAPAQGNATNVNYIAETLTNDLPFPNDATAIEFDPHRPLLKCMTDASLDATIEFFTTELGAQGWIRDMTATGNGKYKTANVDNAYYIRAQHSPRLLVVERAADGRTKVDLNGEAAPPAHMAETTTEKLAAGSTAADKSKTPKSEFDKMSAGILDQVKKITDDALAQARGDVKAPSSKTANADAPASTGEALTQLESNTAPIPVPAAATAVAYKGEDGTLTFSAPSTVKAMAAFYRGALKPLGWTEKPSVINRPNMVLLEFQNGEKDVSVTIMQHAELVGVSANGSGLEVADAADKPAEAENTEPAAELEAEDQSGLPVPTAKTFSSGGSGAFRNEASANVPASLDAVLAFYRRELEKRGWKEAEGAAVSTDKALVSYVAPQGPAVLKLERKSDETVITLFVRHQADAAKSGLLPKPGQVKLLLGNLLDSEGSLTINKQTIKVKGGVGTKSPDGPSLEVPPGKYTVATKSGGKGGSQEITVGADEIWGLMIGPGGALPLQMY